MLTSWPLRFKMGAWLHLSWVTFVLSLGFVRTGWTDGRRTDRQKEAYRYVSLQSLHHQPSSSSSSCSVLWSYRNCAHHSITNEINEPWSCMLRWDQSVEQRRRHRRYPFNGSPVLLTTRWDISEVEGSLYQSYLPEMFSRQTLDQRSPLRSTARDVMG